MPGARNEHVIVQVLDAGNGALPAPEDAPQRPPEAPQRAQDMSQQELRRGEGDIIDDLFRADQQSKQRIGTVVFERLQVRQFNEDGSPKHDELGELVYGPLELRLRPLRQSEIDRERRRCGRIWLVDDEGARVNDVDPTEFSARMVACALVPEDRQRYLEDRRMWEHFGVGGPVDVLDAWLTAGELNKAGALVMQLSGMPLNATVERFLLKRSNEEEDG
jgi:hypothetical protein